MHLASALGRSGVVALGALVGMAVAACGAHPAPSTPPPAAIHAHEVRPDLDLADTTTWTPINAETRAFVDGDKHAGELAPIGGNRKGSNVAMALLRGVTFEHGTIDVDLRGGGEAGASFLGIAFGVADPNKYEAIYFRPFRFRSQDAVERTHAVQYVAWPEHTWEALRTRSPGVYEAAITPIPDPEGWFHAHIVISNDAVEVFVDGAREPTLVVHRLRHDPGAIALWVDSKAGSFANLRVNPS